MVRASCARWPAGKLPHLAVQAGCRDRRSGSGPGPPSQVRFRFLARPLQHVARRQVPVQRRVLGDEADPAPAAAARAAGRRARWMAPGSAGAGRRPGSAGPLPGPVRADEGHDVPGRDGEVAVTQGPGAADSRLATRAISVSACQTAGLDAFMRPARPAPRVARLVSRRRRGAQENPAASSRTGPSSRRRPAPPPPRCAPSRAGPAQRRLLGQPDPRQRPGDERALAGPADGQTPVLEAPGTPSARCSG